MSGKTDLLARLKAYGDASGSPDIVHALGTPGSFIVLRDETVPTGIAYADPGMIDGLCTAIGGQLDGGGIITVVAPGPSFSAATASDFKIAPAAPTIYDTITGGKAAQRIVLVFTNLNGTIGHGTGNIQLRGGVNFSPVSPNAALQLWFDGAAWLEIAQAA